MKVLLIYPSSFFSSRWGKSYFLKSHLLSLFSFLKSENDVDILDLEVEAGNPDTEEEVEQFKEKATRLISKYKFDIVGISCWSSLNYLSSLMIARTCKDINNNCIIVAGGYHPSALPGDFIYKGSPFDFVITGEGEISFLKLCRKFKKIKHSAISMGKVIRGIPLDLDRYPDSLSWQEYKYSSLHKHKQIGIYLSRGCPFSCAFCMEGAKGHSGWRSYSIDNSIKMIERAIDILKPRDILISDACFGLKKQWRREFLSELIRRKIDKIFWAELRPDMIEKEDIRLFSKLNFILYLGLESGSEKMLYIMRKTANPKEYLNRSREAIDYLNRKKILHSIHIIFNHPGETYSTFKETIDFLKSLIMHRKRISFRIPAQNYALFPGSYVYNNLTYYEKKYGTVIKNKEWWKQEREQHKLATAIIPSTELVKKVKDINYWEKEINDINNYCKSRLPLGILALLSLSAEKGKHF